MDAENTLDEPAKVSPVDSTIRVTGDAFERELPAHSVSVIRFPTG